LRHSRPSFMSSIPHWHTFGHPRPGHVHPTPRFRHRHPPCLHQLVRHACPVRVIQALVWSSCHVRVHPLPRFASSSLVTSSPLVCVVPCPSLSHPRLVASPATVASSSLRSRTPALPAPPSFMLSLSSLCDTSTCKRIIQ